MAYAVTAVVAVVALLRRPPADCPAALSAVYLVAIAFFVPVFVFDAPVAAVGGIVIAHGLTCCSSGWSPAAHPT